MIITGYNLYIFFTIICKICNISTLLTANSQSKPNRIKPLCPHPRLPKPPPPTPLRLSLRPSPCLLKFKTLPIPPPPPSYSPPSPQFAYHYQRGRLREYSQLFRLPSRQHYLHTPNPPPPPTFSKRGVGG